MQTAAPVSPMMPLLQLSMETLVCLWGELVEAACGQHGFGGHTAELYAYRFVPYSPLAHRDGMARTGLGQAEAAQLQQTAAITLLALCQWFSTVYPVTLTIDNLAPSMWYEATHGAFTHRVHVKVVRIPAHGL